MKFIEEDNIIIMATTDREHVNPV